MSESIEQIILEIGQRARQAARALARADSEQKNRALEGIAHELQAARVEIQRENERDVEKARADGLSPAMVDRLTLTDKRLTAMIDGVRDVILLPDPVGESIKDWTRPNGIHIVKRRVPIGVIGIIYESRPNVTCDAAILCLKTGNATVLRGGSEAFYSNQAIGAAMSRGITRAGLPAEAVQVLPTTDRAAIPALCALDQYIDVMVPRGGKGLIETVVKHARMPVIKHYHGVCHVYVDRSADFEMAENIAINAKCQRPGVCNAMETLLVHRDVALDFLPGMVTKFREQKCRIYGDEGARKIVPDLEVATEENWTTEWLELTLSIRVVDNLDSAIDHLDKYGSHHSDTIITRDEVAAHRFLNEVDSATVYWNASTRFTDGGEFGFGAEIGISTDKLHARGPMALEELTTYKYQIIGDGQIRE